VTERTYPSFAHFGVFTKSSILSSHISDACPLTNTEFILLLAKPKETKKEKRDEEREKKGETKKTQSKHIT